MTYKTVYLSVIYCRTWIELYAIARRLNGKFSWCLFSNRWCGKSYIRWQQSYTWCHI